MLNVFKNLDWTILLNIIPALLCITFHELAHGLVAYRLRDPTAKDAGRLSLNPLKHISLPGLLMMIFYGFGWAKPVPVNMSNFKNPKKGMAITALAGPASNVVFAVMILFIYGAVAPGLTGRSSAGDIVLYLLSRTAYVSVAFAVFNMFPIPPLDGSKIFFALLPDSAYYRLMRIERYGMFILLALVFSGLLDTPLITGIGNLFGFLSNVAEFSARLFY